MRIFFIYFNKPTYHKRLTAEADEKNPDMHYVKKSNLPTIFFLFWKTQLFHKKYCTYVKINSIYI